MTYVPRYAAFRFLAPEYDAVSRTARFHYAFDDALRFTETIEFDPDGRGGESGIPAEDVHALLFPLSVALGISYYKLSPTPVLRSEYGLLDEGAQAFWRKFYRNGLGEYCHRNDISPRHIAAEFENAPDARHFDPVGVPTEERAFVCIGGGKDSLISVEMMRASGTPFEAFTFGRSPNALHLDTIRVAGLDRSFVRRTIDPELVRLSGEPGYYNGHVPITGMIHFVLLVLCALTRTRWAVFSNEASADEGNMVWDGIEVNHQYSKSYGFERDFRDYVSSRVAGGIEIFSLLRGLHEIAIAERFSRHPEYFGVFSSCNRNFHLAGSRLGPESRWCGECPKCAFVAVLLAAFLPTATLVGIFGRDLLDDESLLPMFRALLGYDADKPFECVGTAEEVALAMIMAVERREAAGEPLGTALGWFAATVAPTFSESERKEMRARLLATDTGRTLVPARFGELTK